MMISDDYKLPQEDHPSDTKRGGVWIYHKEAISAQGVKVSQLPGCLVCEVPIQNESLSEPESRQLSNFPQGNWKFTFQYH